MSTRVEGHSKKSDEAGRIRATSLSKKFDDVHAVRDVSFDISNGTTTAIVGANGSGKSTLLRMLYGMCTPDEGEISVCGHNPFQDPKRVYAFARYLSQHISLDVEMTGLETLSLFAKLYGIPKANTEQQLEAVIQQFGMSDFVSRRIAKLSGGMKQRLHLAICLLGESSLILLDEPTSNLDPEGKLEFWNWTKGHTDANGTIILTTHDIEFAESHASRVILLDQGCVVLDETPKNIVEQHSKPVVFATTYSQKNAHKAKTTLEAMEGVSSVDSLDQTQVAIVLLAKNCSDASIVAELEKQEIELQSYRRETGLAAAYYLLAGRRLKSKHHIEGARGRRKGRRR